jgi:hypothetical protein
MRAAPLAALGLALAAAACGDNRPGLGFDDFADAQRAAECTHDVTCGLFADEATCLAYFRARPDRDLAAAVANGKVHYDAQRAEQCVDALAMRGCDLTLRADRDVAACDLVLTGTLPDDASCAFDAECVSGACDAPACSPATCCLGACAATLADAACRRDDQCGVDQFCGEDHACHARALAGATCEADGECADGLGCIGVTELMPGNCRALPHLGEACPYLRCADVGATCTGGTCAAVGLPGAACATDDDCSPFALCDTAAQRCVDVPTLGMPCTGSCAGEAWCDLDATHTCIAPKPDGDPCTASDQCASLFCQENVVFDQCAAAAVCT